MQFKSLADTPERYKDIGKTLDNYPPLEYQLFSHDGYDENGCASMIFYDCVLKVDIGDMTIGSKFYSIMLDYSRGIIHLGTSDTGDTAYIFKIQ